MDMSFPPRTGERLAPPRLTYRTLLAAVRAGGKQPAGADAPHGPSCPEELGLAGDLCLAAVILGRPGWPDAARALGGGFACRGS